jgi:uncharacterized membrane protein
MSTTQIDPRGPRFGAAITNALSLIIFFLALDASSVNFAYVLLAFVWFTFLIGTALGNMRHPYGLLFKKLVRPRLQAPKELEDARPPRFAQLIGLLVATLGFVLGFTLGANGLAIAAGLLFVASFLQAYFGFCLGCKIYLGLRRIGLIRG